jgi:hypothetical protein
VPSVLLALGALACLTVLAYAAAPLGDRGGAERKPLPAPTWRPTISQHPDKAAVSSTARFEFSAGRRAQRFRCNLDRRGWSPCRAPVAFARLTPGRHSFAVRAFDRQGRSSATTRFRWRVLALQGFAIQPRLSGIGALYPGAPPVSLPVKIDNPNPVPIFVTALRVAATADQPGCVGATNLTLTAASVSKAAPLRVPARGSVNLPAPGVAPPAIQLRDLPVNQDACQRARFPLAFSGDARG